MSIAGVDAHATYLVVTIVSKQGERLVGPKRIPNEEPHRLVRLLDEHGPAEVVVEASPAWPWLYDRLANGPHRLVVAHAKRLRGLAEQTYKRDEVDSELLARMRLAGLIPEVHPKSPEQRDWATLVRHRARLSRMRTAAVNRIHGQIQTVGLRVDRGRLLTKDGRRWVHAEAWQRFSAGQRRAVDDQFDLIDQLSDMMDSAQARIEKVAQGVPAAQILETVPGIGCYRALLIAAEVLPIERFAKPEHLVSYAGLAPRSRRSGMAPVRMGSTPSGVNRWLRGAFVRTVVSHFTAAPDSWLSAYYESQKERLSWQVARVATARKLARAIHAMLRTGETWRSE